MDILDNIKYLLIKCGKSQVELTNHLHLCKAVFSDWNSGRSKSYMKHLPDIADYFGVSVDYLLGKEQKEKSTGKADELDNLLIEEFSGLDKEEQEKLIKLLNNPEKLKAVLSLL